MADRPSLFRRHLKRVFYEHGWADRVLENFTLELNRGGIAWFGLNHVARGSTMRIPTIGLHMRPVELLVAELQGAKLQAWRPATVDCPLSTIPGSHCPDQIDLLDPSDPQTLAELVATEAVTKGLTHVRPLTDYAALCSALASRQKKLAPNDVMPTMRLVALFLILGRNDDAVTALNEATFRYLRSAAGTGLIFERFAENVHSRVVET